MTTIRRRALAGMTAAVIALPLGAFVLPGTAGAATLPASTARMLQHMVAEEKLAHDVYVELAATSGARQFSRIAQSETQHQTAVRQLLTRYGIPDPTRGDAAGVFDDPELQAMHDRLVESGSASTAKAAAAGLTIERVDIADLRQAIASRPPADVAAVLDALLRGSTNHLAAFTRLEASAAR